MSTILAAMTALEDGELFLKMQSDTQTCSRVNLRGAFSLSSSTSNDNVQEHAELQPLSCGNCHVRVVNQDGLAASHWMLVYHRLDSFW